VFHDFPRHFLLQGLAVEVAEGVRAGVVGVFVLPTNPAMVTVPCSVVVVFGVER